MNESFLNPSAYGISVMVDYKPVAEILKMLSDSAAKYSRIWRLGRITGRTSQKCSILRALPIIYVQDLSRSYLGAVVSFFFAPYVMVVVHAVVHLVAALLYEREGRGFNCRWCNWNFLWT